MKILAIRIQSRMRRAVEAAVAAEAAEAEPSHVPRAPGIDADAARRTLRIGIGRFTSPADIDFAVAALAAAHASVASHPIEA